MPSPEEEKKAYEAMTPAEKRATGKRLEEVKKIENQRESAESTKEEIERAVRSLDANSFDIEMLANNWELLKRELLVKAEKISNERHSGGPNGY